MHIHFLFEINLKYLVEICYWLFNLHYYVDNSKLLISMSLNDTSLNYVVSKLKYLLVISNNIF